LDVWSIEKLKRHVKFSTRQKLKQIKQNYQPTVDNLECQDHVPCTFRRVNDARKTAIINRKLAKRNIDIAALQETSLAASGSLKEEYTFFWQGLGPHEHRIHGVGIAVHNSILLSVQPPSQGTERIIPLLLKTSSGPTYIFSVYAPTLSSSPEVKDDFFEELEKRIRGIPDKENLILLEDFKA
jgi:exonuclease III